MLRASLLGFALFGAGCSAAAPLPVAPAVPSPVAASPAPAASPEPVVFLAPRPEAPSAPASSPAPIGVAECDRYVALVDACPADASSRQGGTRRLLEKDAPRRWREMARSSTEGRLAVTFACQAGGSRGFGRSPAVEPSCLSLSRGASLLHAGRQNLPGLGTTRRTRGEVGEESRGRLFQSPLVAPHALDQRGGRLALAGRSTWPRCSQASAALDDRFFRSLRTELLGAQTILRISRETKNQPWRVAEPVSNASL